MKFFADQVEAGQEVGMAKVHILVPVRQGDFLLDKGGKRIEEGMQGQGKQGIASLQGAETGCFQREPKDSFGQNLAAEALNDLWLERRKGPLDTTKATHEKIAYSERSRH